MYGGREKEKVNIHSTYMFENTILCDLSHKKGKYELRPKISGI